MDYRITCVCGHRFIVPQEKLGGPIVCPACQQKLSAVVDTSAAPARAGLPAGPVTASAGNATAAATVVDSGSEGGGVQNAAAEETKRCPFCGEVILAVAKKCKHCGEFLDRAFPLGGPVHPAQRTPAPGQPEAPPGADAAPAYSVSISQWDNFWKFIILFTIALVISVGLWFFNVPWGWAAIPGVFVMCGFVGWYFYLVASHTRYIVRPLRIDTERGLLAKEINTLEMFRIADLELKQGLIQRILGIGTIKLTTKDATAPHLHLQQVPRAREIYTYIKTQIPLAARQRGAVYMEQ